MDERLRQYILDRRAATQDQTDDELIAGMGKAGSQLGAAIAGAKPVDTSTYDQMIADAGARRKEVSDFLKQKYESDLAMERDSSKQESKPEPKPLFEDNIESINGKNMKVKYRLDPMTGERIGMSVIGPATEFDIKQANFNLELSRKQDEDRRRREGQEFKQSTALTAEERKIDAPALEESIKAIRSKYKDGNLPGFVDVPKDHGVLGAIKGKATQGYEAVRRGIGLASPDEEAIRSEVTRLVNADLKLQSGSAVTESEYDRFKAAIKAGNWGDYTPRQVMKYVDIMERSLKARQDSIRSGAPGVYDKVKANQSNKPTTTGLKQVVRKQYSKTANKTKLIYADGSEEIVDGQR